MKLELNAIEQQTLIKHRKMKITRFALLLMMGVLFAATTQLHAQHYPAGSAGIKAGSLPSPGFTFEDDNAFYYAPRMKGFSGLYLNYSFEEFKYVQAPRLMWITDWKILGANYGMAARVPIIDQKITGLFSTAPFIGPSHQEKNRSGLSDVQIEPLLLSWHLMRFDFSAGYSLWIPTSNPDFKNRYFFDNLSQGYWTHSIALGATWYLDERKTWAVSLLNHYDINTPQYSTWVTVPVSPAHPFGADLEDTTLGDIYTLEWAISKTIKNVDVGLTGYYQQQVTDTQGPTPNGPTYQSERIHVAGIGPEVGITLPKWGVSASLRYAYEFSAMDHPQGNLINLTIKKSF